ncbi:MAG: hypothetical protein ACI4V1_09260 [Eubacteriales bacterium]
MSIIYEKKAKEIIYYVYKFRGMGYGVSIIHNCGETAMLPDFSSDLHEAVCFLCYLCENEVKAVELQKASQSYRSSGMRRRVSA